MWGTLLFATHNITPSALQVDRAMSAATSGSTGAIVRAIDARHRATPEISATVYDRDRSGEGRRRQIPPVLVFEPAESARPGVVA